jgi:hypothetical protein
MARMPEKVPVTYYPLATQRAFESSRQRVCQKPYAKYFNETMYIYSDVTPTLKRPMARKDVLALADAATLLVAGDHAVENGWAELEDGTAYVASKTRFPGVTGDMVDWWFWWHSVEPERYALWYPYNHGEARSTFADRLHREDLGHRDKWLGSTHRVTEFIGSRLMSVRIEFVDPGRFGLPFDALERAGYAAAVCAVIWHAFLPLKVGDMLHLWRKTNDGGGLELRSRYWLAHQVHLDVLGLFNIPLDFAGGVLGIKRLLAGESIAYEQFLHDQIEFTNLASILPALYQEYGGGDMRFKSDAK